MPSIESELEDVAKLRHMANEFAEGFNTGDVERIMRFYGDSYVDINLRNPVQSRQERREYYAQVIRKGGFKVQVQPEEILIRGEYAFIRVGLWRRGCGLALRKTPRTRHRLIVMVSAILFVITSPG